MQWIIRKRNEDNVNNDTTYDNKEWAIKCLKSLRINYPDNTFDFYELKEVETKLDI